MSDDGIEKAINIPLAAEADDPDIKAHAELFQRVAMQLSGSDPAMAAAVLCEAMAMVIFRASPDFEEGIKMTVDCIRIYLDSFARIKDQK